MSEWSAPLVQIFEKAVGNIEAGILRRGDEQRGLGEVDLLLRAGDDLFPAVSVSHNLKSSDTEDTKDTEENKNNN